MLNNLKLCFTTIGCFESITADLEMHVPAKEFLI